MSTNMPKPMTYRTSVRAYFKRALPGLAVGFVVTSASIIAAILTSRSQWLWLGGGVLTLLGIPLTFLRLIARGPAGALEEMPPKTIAVQGQPGVRPNIDHMHHTHARIHENFSVITGVVLLILGAILAGIAAPAMELLTSR